MPEKNHVSLSQMVQALLETGLSERRLGQLLDASQSTVHRMKKRPKYKTSDQLGQRVRALYKRRKSAAMVA